MHKRKTFESCNFTFCTPATDVKLTFLRLEASITVRYVWLLTNLDRLIVAEDPAKPLASKREADGEFLIHAGARVVEPKEVALRDGGQAER
jgi:hypothetical protein